MVAVRDPAGATELLEARGDGDAAEAELIRRLVARDARGRSGRDREPQPARLRPAVPRSARAPARRAARARPHRRRRACASARRGAACAIGATIRARRVRFVAPGRELIDTLDAVLRHDFATRELPGHGLKAVARHSGIAGPDREQIRGDQIYATYRTRSRARAALRDRRRRGGRRPRADARRRRVRARADGAAPLRAARRRGRGDRRDRSAARARVPARGRRAARARAGRRHARTAAPRCTCSRPASRTAS